MTVAGDGNYGGGASGYHSTASGRDLECSPASGGLEPVEGAPQRGGTGHGAGRRARDAHLRRPPGSLGSARPQRAVQADAALCPVAARSAPTSLPMGHSHQTKVTLGQPAQATCFCDAAPYRTTTAAGGSPVTDLPVGLSRNTAAILSAVLHSRGTGLPCAAGCARAGRTDRPSDYPLPADQPCCHIAAPQPAPPEGIVTSFPWSRRAAPVTTMAHSHAASAKRLPGGLGGAAPASRCTTLPHRDWLPATPVPDGEASFKSTLDCSTWWAAAVKRRGRQGRARVQPAQRRDPCATSCTATRRQGGGSWWRCPTA
jgi:hypothetical protein